MILKSHSRLNPKEAAARSGSGMPRGLGRGETGGTCPDTFEIYAISLLVFKRFVKTYLHLRVYTTQDMMAMLTMTTHVRMKDVGSNGPPGVILGSSSLP